MDYDEIHDRTVRRLVKSVYNQCLINNAERGTYVEHMIAPALEELQWRLTWPWAAWDFQHPEGARIEVKQSAARQPWHQRPDSEPLPRSSPGWFGIKKPSEGYYSEDGTWVETKPPQRHADIYVFAWHPVTDLRNADRRRRARPSAAGPVEVLRGCRRESTSAQRRQNRRHNPRTARQVRPRCALLRGAGRQRDQGAGISRQLEGGSRGGRP